MMYVVCLIYVAIVYLRPGELVPGWADLHIAATALAAAGVAAAASLVMQPRRVADLPIDLCFLGFCLASIVSNPASGRLAAGWDAFVKLLPLIGFYLLIRIAVRTGRQLRWAIAVIVVLTLFQAANGIVQYWTGAGFGGATAVVEGAGRLDPDLLDGLDGASVTRVRGTGIFGDPNDLAMSLVLVFPFLFSAVLSAGPGRVRRLLGVVALAILSYALYLTQSRGGFVALGALGAAYAYRRFGRWAALTSAALIVAVLLAGPGRLQQLTASEESAQERIQVWSAGLEMLKSSPITGIGLDQFVAHSELVAHNSFVHVLAETGLIGGFFFVGLFYWCLVGNGSLRNMAGAAASPLALDLWASCIGVGVCVCFLSRQQSPVLYVPLVLGAVRIAVEQQPDHEVPVQRWWDWPLVLMVLMGVVVATYVAVRVLAVWSPV